MTTMNYNGISTCAVGEEKYEYFPVSVRPRPKRQYCQYEYRHTDGELFSGVFADLDKARQARDEWMTATGRQTETDK